MICRSLTWSFWRLPGCGRPRVSWVDGSLLGMSNIRFGWYRFSFVCGYCRNNRGAVVECFSWCILHRSSDSFGSLPIWRRTRNCRRHRSVLERIYTRIFHLRLLFLSKPWAHRHTKHVQWTRSFWCRLFRGSYLVSNCHKMRQILQTRAPDQN